MFCMSCGAVLPDNVAFCPDCGAKVTGEGNSEKSYLHSVKCTTCGGSDVRKVYKGKYRCEHCGAIFYTDEQKNDEDQEAVAAQVAVLLSEAAAFADKKDYKNELQTLIKAMNLAPEDNSVLLRLGRAYWRLGSLEKAMEYYRIAEDLYPNDPAVYNNIGTNYFKSGHYAQAKEQYEKAVAIIAADPMSACAEDVAITYGNYAYCLGKLGDMKNAKKYLSIAKEKGYSKDSIDTICRDLHLFRFLV